MQALKSIAWVSLIAVVCVANVAARAEGKQENPFRTSAWKAKTVAATEVIPAPEIPIPRADSDRKPMDALGIEIGLPAGKLPQDHAARLVNTAPLAGDMPRPWPTQVYQWQAAATRHQPLYFDEINAERYGYSCNWVAQPFVSTAHFFATIPALPYLKATNCPWECQYTLGHYRPGSCPPYRRHCWPCSTVGATSEVGSLAWLILVLP